MRYGYRSQPDDEPKPSEYGIVAFLPPYLETIVRPIRERFDPEYSLIEGCVTLVAPFQTRRPLHEISDVVGRVAAQQQPVSLELDGIQDFYPEYPLIVWKLIVNPELNCLYKELYTSLDLAVPYRSFCPHVTVAREISQHRLMLVKEKIFPYLPRETFTLEAIDLISPIAEGNWVSVRTFIFTT